ncbi:MAG: lipopolysaccharide biosynthesis protein [Muribaculum sp.]|nr:lipopolysaccharide biosynthesis protein [Muribaculum sp.]
MGESELKRKTASTLKWNSIDRISTQILYGVSGIFLAILLSKEDFGLVGVLAIFQAFAILFVDSGFGSALLQKKNPDEEDYSTVFWFNLAVSVVVYALLYACAPYIADFFGDNRLVAMSRVMFLTFVLTGLGIVQTNRLMKRMDVKQIAIADLIALSISATIGIWLALAGYGAWAIVWQSVALAGIKSGWLWIIGHWKPIPVFSMRTLRDIRHLGLSVFSTQMLNTIIQNIYQFVIGKWYSLAQLGVYSQADKWSKMGSASLSQILTSSFVPLLAGVQDDMVTFHRYMKRVDRFAAMLTIPGLVIVACCGESLFHALFGTKWDVAIPLFQVLCLRGIGVVFISFYSNCIMSLGKGRQIVTVEIVKDTTTVLALIATVFSMNLDVLVWGQLAATVATWIAAASIVSKSTGYRKRDLLMDLCPFILGALVSAGAIWLVPVPSGDIQSPLNATSIISLGVQSISGLTAAVITLYLLRVPEVSEIHRLVK